MSAGGKGGRLPPQFSAQSHGNADDLSFSPGLLLAMPSLPTLLVTHVPVVSLALVIVITKKWVDAFLCFQTRHGAPSKVTPGFTST